MKATFNDQDFPAIPKSNFTSRGGFIVKPCIFPSKLEENSLDSAQ